MTYQFVSQAFVRRMEAVGMARAVAGALANARESVVLGGLATGRDVNESAARTDSHIRELELRIGQQLKERELRFTVRMGAMLAATIAILGALITFK